MVPAYLSNRIPLPSFIILQFLQWIDKFYFLIFVVHFLADQIVMSPKQSHSLTLVIIRLNKERLLQRQPEILAHLHKLLDICLKPQREKAKTNKIGDFRIRFTGVEQDEEGENLQLVFHCFACEQNFLIKIVCNFTS